MFYAIDRDQLMRVSSRFSTIPPFVKGDRTIASRHLGASALSAMQQEFVRLYRVNSRGENEKNVIRDHNTVIMCNIFHSLRRNK